MKHRILSFNVKSVFPASDPAALDILRLMAGYNDLAFLTGWMEDAPVISEDRAKEAIAASRHFLLLRFIISLLHEILKVLEDLSPEFRKIVALMDEDGKKALKRLKEVRTKPDKAFDKLLKRTRNRVTFHYDRDRFKAGINRLIERYGNDCKSTLVVYQEDLGVRPHYSLADQVRTEIAFVLDGRSGPRPEIDVTGELLDCLKQVVVSAMAAYLKDRNLVDVFTEESAVNVETGTVNPN